MFSCTVGIFYGDIMGNPSSGGGTWISNFNGIATNDNTLGEGTIRAINGGGYDVSTGLNTSFSAFFTVGDDEYELQMSENSYCTMDESSEYSYCWFLPIC